MSLPAELSMEHLRQWIGRSETARDVVTLAPITALSATLDRPDVPDTLPACWHWLYFLPMHRQSEIGADGHAKRGGFLPPVPLPRRMWAGSRLEFLAPLLVGQSMERTSTISDVVRKHGKGGWLVFVKVRHEISSNGILAVTDEHDIVYRDNPSSVRTEPVEVPHPSTSSGRTEIAPSMPAPQWQRTIVPDDVLLFRYSALTFNGHRIHYDRKYVTEVEGYPGLIVHGPLIATLLLDLLRRELPAAQVKSFSFKAMKPIFDIAPFEVCGRQVDANTVELWARTPQGDVAMQAQARI